MPFRYVKTLDANQSRVMREYTITDAQVLSVGEAVRLVSGKLVTSGAAATVLGIVQGFVNADGSPLTTNGVGGDFQGTFTAPTSNTVKALVDVSTSSLYSVPANAGTLATHVGQNMDCTAASDTLDVASLLATSQQFFIHDLDTSAGAPANSLIVSIQESQVKI